MGLGETIYLLQGYLSYSGVYCSRRWGNLNNYEGRPESKERMRIAHCADPPPLRLRARPFAPPFLFSLR
jgi:hypothetical protein